MGKGTLIPPYLQNKSLADISKDGLEPETTDSILAANGTDDFFGEDNNTPPAPYAPATGITGPPKSMENNTKTGGLNTRKGM